MKRQMQCCLVFALTLSTFDAHGQLRTKPEPAGRAQTIEISATIYGNFDYNFEGVGAWVGNALIRFGDKPTAVTTFADRNTSFGQRPNGAIYGTETISLRFADGRGAFDIVARFEGTPASTPGLYMLHEIGAICNGTGAYSGVSGYVAVQGPFLFPDPSVTPGAPPWVAEIHGAISGLQKQ